MEKGKCVMIAPAGNSIEKLFIGLREFSCSRVIIITERDNRAQAEKIKNGIEQFRISADIIEIKSADSIEETFKAIFNLKKRYGMENIIINCVSGSQLANSILICAAFINGIKAFTVKKDEVIVLPVLNYPYYQFLTSRKLEILDVLKREGHCSSLDRLGKKTNMSLPLISYHIHGNSKSEGLEGLGLVETEEKKGKIDIRLSRPGKLLVQDCCR